MEHLIPPAGAGTYKKRQHKRIARSLQMGTHLITKHKGDKKQMRSSKAAGRLQP